MQLIPLPAFTDNYIWLLHNGQQALVVDPGDAQPVTDALQRLGLQLETILVTHHHDDHTGGVMLLRELTGAKVFGPVMEPMPEPIARLSGGEQVDALGLSFSVLDVPGHTRGHIAYYACPEAQAPLLFCGDTLFSAGCGRLFEGTPRQMLTSLTALSKLPDATRVCCAHEYTLGNLKFAIAVEPANQDLARHLNTVARLRERQQPSLPSTLGLERRINPFLRTRELALIGAAKTFDPSAQDEVAIFAALRQWKNQFS